MRKTIAIAALAGLAAAATAQTQLNITLTPDRDSVVEGETVRFTVFTEFENLLSGGVFSPLVAFTTQVTSNGSAATLSGSGFTGPAAISGPGGTLDQSDWAAGHFVIVADGSGQPVFNISNGAFELGYFDITFDTVGEYGISLDSIGGQVVAAFLAANVPSFWFADDFPANPTAADFLATVNTATITVVPTPGAAALLGLGGVAALRRRR